MTLSAVTIRPISVLSNISKIIEKIIHKCLFFFLERNNYLYELQLGFQNKTSTNHAVIDSTERIREALNQGLLACGVYIDLQTAFDTVNHPILLVKLNYYGVRGIVNDWLF